jgi:hypothetical protein
MEKALEAEEDEGVSVVGTSRGGEASCETVASRLAI